MDYKQTAGFAEVKSDSTREIEALFRRHYEADTDNEVTTPESFTDGQTVWLSQWGHASWNPGMVPVGQGTIHNVGRDSTVFRGAFFPTEKGVEHFETIKAAGRRVEWSFGFTATRRNGDLLGKSVVYLDGINTYEVSPVMRGAMGAGRTELVSARGMGDDVAARIAANNIRMAQLIGQKFQAEEVMRREAELQGWNAAVAIRDELRRNGAI